MSFALSNTWTHADFSQICRMFDAHKGRGSPVFFLGVKGKALTRRGQHALVNKTINSRLHSLGPLGLHRRQPGWLSGTHFHLTRRGSAQPRKGGHAR